ncbi:hypothetical protein [Jannaschia sp. 2305UL9-9]|uniref:spike base protein, RCAP_Rcc01079 family n=1 Tax=Jannaschia sp. 2305UL9-9 TaxID=3121638 RepID=UPI003529ACE9
MKNPYSSFSGSLRDPIRDAVEMTPNVDTDLLQASRAINVAITGNVRMTLISGSTVTLHVAAGGTFPVRATRIWADGTTAAGIVALF